MKKTLILILVLLLLLLINWPVRVPTFAHPDAPFLNGPLATTGSWVAHPYDLVYTVAFSTAQQPNGPLVVYRAPGADLRNSVPVIALARGPVPLTPLFFPSPDGQYLALLSPLHGGYAANLNGGTLSILPTDGSASPLVMQGISIADQIIWSADSHALYYHSGVQEQLFSPSQFKPGKHKSRPYGWGHDEIHRVDLSGHDTILVRLPQNDSSLRLVGLDRSGALILTLARPHQPVQLLRLPTGTYQAQGQLHSLSQHTLSVVTTLPADILPGNVLRVGSDGNSVECERILSSQPLRYTLIHISFTNNTVSPVKPLFDITRFGQATTPLSRSSDGRVLVMSQVESIRNDLAVQGIANVPAQERLLLFDTITQAAEWLELPYSGQIVQAFWTKHLPLAQLNVVPTDTLAGLLTYHKRSGPSRNARVLQQDEWMLEGHAGRLFGAPPLPSMCYGNCPQGLTGAPHVSATILHGVAFVESNWHQFNTSDYRVMGEAIGSPVESFDGGWGEFQQTWGMPPQCKSLNNCRSDVFKIQYDQSYNIGVGVQSLINAWNGSAGVTSSNDPNDPFKANDWFFAVWAYNGAYGNNPNDVPSSNYGHWYPGAPFRSIYEEYVWYFAAHPQYSSSGWTDNYLPNLGSGLLPPQSDFVGTSDSFVGCVSCTIPDWTSGTYDRDWVGVGAPDAGTATNFKMVYTQLGGEDVVGLPRDNGGGAAVHRWGNGWIQDFGGGSDLPGGLMLADGMTTPYWVYGGVWAQFLTVDHGAGGCHGYPTSSLSPFTGPGTDTYLRQAFQRGYILWDATTGMLAADVCS